ncbi:hypothetical protein GCM10011505_47850 [Tistrella bauzanensis]|uniref:SnoaL-like domain-containing protein n=1 Tax=Tistrella bauzanensis TaxID=657419 RepID=A0ABQ1J736_9PROT|nr:nuclear transport factor 2 family protein [Tistrella bauzanensis]GGB61639.1 hypothetical protein GCM10011505_47850 [Tistrella bauzanensis]
MSAHPPRLISPAPVIRHWITAVNTGNSEALRACFATDAIVTDGSRTIRGLPSIGAWAAHEIFAPRLSMHPIMGREHDDGSDQLVDMLVDGDIDRTGLPDPLIMTLRFTITGALIARLVITLSQRQ